MDQIERRQDNRVAEFIRNSPGAYPKAIGERTIAAALGISRRQVRYSLSRLQDRGRLRREDKASPLGANSVFYWTLLEG